MASAALWGVFLALTTELLSLFNSVTQPWLSAAWTVGLLASAILAWRSGWICFRLDGLARHQYRLPGLPRLLGLVIAGVFAGALLVVAWVSPPNTTDSLLYHMSRVAHWQQAGSLAHYPASYNTQLWAQIWAETAILNFKLLLGSDLASNLVQWFSMLGCLVGVASIANLLGGRRAGAWLAAAFIFSLPLGILESTSTQNDYVAAFWLIVFAYFVVLSKTRPLAVVEWVSMSAALGLGVLTKATVYLYAFPLAAWLVIPQFVNGKRLSSALSGVGLGLSMLALNLGYFARDVITFGGPFGSADWTQSKIASDWPGQFLIGPMRQILLNGATPSERLTQALVEFERAIEGALGVAKPPFTLTWAWNNEDYAGSPLHVLLIAASILAMICLYRRSQARRANSFILQYAVVSSTAFLLFSWLSFFAAQNVRYQLPAFALFAPIVGVAGESFLSRRWIWVVIGGLAVMSVPWILFNQSRPIASWRPRTRVNSIFLESRQRLLFANWPELEEPYSQAANLVLNSSCQEIGLVIDSHDKEYLLWSVLGAPENGMRLEILDPLSASARYMDPTFAPCAVICTICGQDHLDWDGMPLAADFDAARVSSLLEQG